MKVTIRKRKTSQEKSSLYLDFKEHGVRKKKRLIFMCTIIRKQKQSNLKIKKRWSWLNA